MSGAMNDSKEDLQQPEDDGSLQYWMWCEEEEYKKKEGGPPSPKSFDDKGLRQSKKLWENVKEPLDIWSIYIIMEE